MQTQQPYLNNRSNPRGDETMNPSGGDDLIYSENSLRRNINSSFASALGLPTSAATFQSRMMVLGCTSPLVAQSSTRSDIKSKDDDTSQQSRRSSLCSAASARSWTPDDSGSGDDDSGSVENDDDDDTGLSQLASQWEQHAALPISSFWSATKTTVENVSSARAPLGNGQQKAMHQNRVAATSGVVTNDDDDDDALPPPPTKPRRPLSAYNLFFKYDRARLLIHSEGGEKSLEDAPPPPRGLMAADVANLLENNPYHVDRDKRRHRKSHGRVSFRELTKIILNNWKAVDAVSRAPFETLAAGHKAEYEAEAADYKAWKANEQRLRARRKRKSAKEARAALKQASSSAAAATAPWCQGQESVAGREGTEQAIKRNVRRRVSAPGVLTVPGTMGARHGGLPMMMLPDGARSSVTTTVTSLARQVSHAGRAAYFLGASDTPLPFRSEEEPLLPFDDPQQQPLPFHTAPTNFEPISRFPGVNIRPVDFSAPRRVSCPSETVEKDVLNFLKQLDWDQLE